MNVIKLKILPLIVCLTEVSAACRAGNFQPRPEDEVIELDAAGESPKAKEREYKPDDAVSPLLIFRKSPSVFCIRSNFPCTSFDESENA